jgi:hypothetical protein
MESNEIMRNQIFEIIKNQIKSNTPPETKQTFDRLKGLGYSDLDTKKLIAQCVAVEIYNVMKHKEPYNESRYISNLKKLPEEPYQD